MALHAGTVYSSVHVHLPVATSLAPAPPPVVLADPDANTTSVSVTLGPAGASANATVTMATTINILYNPDFYYGLDGWNCTGSCTWSPTVTDRRGVKSSGGAVNLTAYANISQFILIPQGVDIISATLTLKIASDKNNRIFYVDLLDESGTLISSQSNTTSKDWVNTTFNFTGLLQPGKGYYLVIKVNETSFYLYVDQAYLTVQASKPIYVGPVLAANVTDGRVYYFTLRLVWGESIIDPSLNATIWLVNATGYRSTPLVITGGSPLGSSTGQIPAGPPPAGYMYSLLIWVSASKAPGTSSTLVFELEYCAEGLGVCVSYPVRVTLDPPASN